MVSIDVRAALHNERRRQAGVGGVEAAKASSEFKAAAAAVATALKQASVRRIPNDLHGYAVGAEAVEGLYYVPEFVSEEEEQALVRYIDLHPPSKWAQAQGRRMLNFGGRPGELQIQEALPAGVQALVERMVASGLCAPDKPPNHCLVNEYVNGNGIDPHQDGELYAPCVATITLEGSAVMDFYCLSAERVCDPSSLQVLLQPRGLLLMTGPAYTEMRHGISFQTEDIITKRCCNLGLTSSVSVGHVLHRAQIRKSLVFVHKKTG